MGDDDARRRAKKIEIIHFWRDLHWNPLTVNYDFSLDAFSHLYKRAYPSDGWSVRRSFGPSVRRSVGPSVRRSVGPSVCRPVGWSVICFFCMPKIKDFLHENPQNGPDFALLGWVACLMCWMCFMCIMCLLGLVLAYVGPTVPMSLCM